MPIQIGASKSEIFFECGSLGPPGVIVTAFSGVEGISELFSFDVELATEDAALDFSAVVGQAATLSWGTSSGERYVSGIVAAFEQRGGGRRYSYYRARIVPKAWFLTLRQNCKIFQGDDVKAIVTKVLQKAGLADGTDFTFAKYVAAHPAREYCVQYRETDWDFISRLCEDEGISYFFRHDASGHKLVFTDDKSAFEPIEGTSTIPHRVAGGMVEEEEAIYSFGYAESVRSGKVVLRDYLFTNPSLDLTSDPATASTNPELEVYDYPGGFDNKGWAGTLAGYRGASLRSLRALGRGESDARSLVPGYSFTLAEHQRDDRNLSYVITRVEHWGDQRQALGEDASNRTTDSPYGNSFECVPASIDYRPERLTPRPVVEGSQTALVCGPPGEEIWVDKYGRIKVQFHWDRLGAKDDKSTCWVRVSQAWAGAGWGITFWPRVGMEVVIDFLEGDPDHPLVTGCVYNGLNPVPYTLADEKTKSTIKSNSTPGGGGFNEIRFEDAKGAEEIYIHAQKDRNIVVENCETHSVGVDRTKTIGRDETTHVKHDRTETVDNDESITVNGSRTEVVALTETITIGLARTTNVGAVEQLIVGAARDQQVKLGETIQIGTDQEVQVGQNQSIQVQGNHSLAVKGNSQVGVEGDRTLQVTGNHTSSVKGDDTVSIKGESSVTVESGQSVEVTKGIKITAGESWEIECGSASISLAKDGTIKIKGGDITVEASGKLTLKGSSIAEN